MRYRPDNPYTKVTTHAATVENLQRVLQQHRQSKPYVWTLEFGSEIPAGARVRLNDGEVNLNTEHTD